MYYLYIIGGDKIMKYMIETTEDGCVQTLEFDNGEIYTSNVKRTIFGCEITPNFSSQLAENDYCEWAVKTVDDLLDGTRFLEFIEFANM